ncbi:MAG: cysteine synthase A, partial [Desulfovibrio sp.]|nr:cysteine synthase A [Desulfovibrio sp.]
MPEKVFASIDELIGATPLLELKFLKKSQDLKARLLAKLEFMNPAGSVKDRVAKNILDQAEKDGILKPGGVIIEPTSGNTGIGLACLAAARGYRLIVVMPDSMSRERRQQIAAYGAEVVLTPGAEGMKGAIAKAEELRKTTPDSIIAGQFLNPANPAAHYRGTGPEIWEATEGKVDILVAGAGTGGTLTGAGRFLKNKNPAIEIVAVEPASSPVITGGAPGPHKIQGIGPGFIPKNLDISLLNRVEIIPDDEALAMTRTLARKGGLLCGVSSGAAAAAAVKIAKKARNEGKNIVVILPDSGDRYLSG